MTRLVMAVLTGALCFCSYVEIKTGLPSLTARLLTQHGSSSPVGPVLSIDLKTCFLLQVLISAIALGAPYVAPEYIHLGSWTLHRYVPEQRDRVLPPLRVLMGLLALLVSAYFTARIFLVIHEASSQGPLLPADWLSHLFRTEIEWLLGLMAVCGLIIYRYIGKFDALAEKKADEL